MPQLTQTNPTVKQLSLFDLEKLEKRIATPKDFELQDEVSSENEDEHGLV